MSTTTASQKTAIARLHILQDIAYHEGLTATENELSIQTKTMFELDDRNRLKFAGHLMDIISVDELEMTLEEREATLWALGVVTDVDKASYAERITALLEQRFDKKYSAEDHEALVRQINAGLDAIARGYNAAATIVKLKRQNGELLSVVREVGASQIVSANIRTRLNHVADKIDPKHS